MKSKTFLFATVFTFNFLLLTFYCSAQTIVGGPIYANTTWTMSGSPYIVQSSNIAVMTGATLTIDAGVIVKFDSSRAIQVFGTLRALGTNAQPIKFTSNDTTPHPGDWGYILFNNSSTPYNFSTGSGSILKHCIIEYAGGANVTFNGALRLQNATPYINYCSIHDCNKQAIKEWSLTTNLYIDSCNIQHNTADTGMVYITGNATSRAIIRNSIINYDTSSLSSSNAFQTGGIYSATINVSIKNSSISNNNGHGILGYLKNSIVDTIMNCQVNYNTGDGIYYYDNTSNNNIIIIKNNSINNNLQNAIYSESAVAFNSYFITDNIINNNTYNGIYFYCYYANLNNFTLTNNIINNNLQNGIILHFNSYSTSNIFSITNNNVNSNAQNGIDIFKYNGSTDIFNLTSNKITENTQNGIYIYNYYSYNPSNNIYKIISDTINNNSQNGIYFNYVSFTSNDTITIKSNIIYRNISSGINWAFPSTWTTAEPPNILNISKNKIIYNLTKGGVHILNNSPGIAVNTSLTNNIIADNINNVQGGGIYINVVNGSTTMTNNHIVYNYGDSTSAVYINSPGNVTANYNTIVDNRSYDTLNQRAVYFGTTNVLTNPQFRYNNIYNFSCTNPFNDFWDNSFNGDSLNARNCYWQHKTIAGVDSTIYDYFDNSNLGIVWYYPFDTLPNIIAPVTPVRNVTKTDLGGGNIKISWTPNLETDVVGYNVYWGSPSGYSFSNSINVGNVTSHILSSLSITDTIAVTAYDNNATGLNDQINGYESWFSTDTSAFPMILESNMPYNTICSGSGNDASLIVFGPYNDYQFFLDGISVKGPGTSNTASTHSLSDGQHIVFVVGYNACGSDTSQKDTITVNPIPVAGNGNYNVCFGNCVQIGPVSIPGYSYRWSPATFLNDPNIANPIATPTANINYTLTVTDTLTGCTGTNTGNYGIIIGHTTVNLGADTTICTSQSLTLNAGIHSSYHWFPGGQTTQTITVNGSALGVGVFTFIVQVTDTCTNSDTIVVTITVCTGILEEGDNNEIKIYPNPATDNLTVECPQQATIEITNIQGQLIETLATTGNKTNIDVSALARGMYFVKVKTEKGVESRKFVKL